MANEVKKFIREAGYEPLEDRCIIVKYAPANLSDLRSSGVYATMYAGSFKNWHKENLDRTLKALTELGNRAS